MNDLIKIVIVAGPTASGKTSYAIELAKKLNGELISADSRQIYKYLNIGTNKGNLEYRDEQAFIDGVKIHLIDFLEPDKTFNVFEWNSLAAAKIEELLAQEITPIVVGGTGLYIDSLIKKYDYSTPYKLDTGLRNLLIEVDTSNLLEMQNWFSKFMPSLWVSFNASDRGNPRRLQRMVVKLLEDKNEIHQIYKVYDYIMYYPKFDLEELKTRIESRVDEMFKYGLVEETMKILAMGYSKNSAGLNVMGYKEILKYIEGLLSLEDAKSLLKVAHKQYARRQRKWFEGDGRNYILKIVNYA